MKILKLTYIKLILGYLQQDAKNPNWGIKFSPKVRFSQSASSL